MKITHLMCCTIGGAALLTTISLTSCGGNREENQKLSFESYEFHSQAIEADTDSVADDESGVWKVEGTGIMPLALGRHDVTALRDTLSRLAEVEFVKGEARIRLPEILRHVDVRNDSIEAGSQYAKNLTLELLTPEICVFRIFSYAYPHGAAHGSYSNIYVNYDISRGRILTVDDLFASNSRDALYAAIVGRLKEGSWQLIIPENDIPFPTTFSITRSGIDFVYGIYTVAPYSDGEPHVSFNSYELSEFLTPAGRDLLNVETPAD